MLVSLPISYLLLYIILPFFLFFPKLLEIRLMKVGRLQFSILFVECPFGKKEVFYIKY